MTEPETTVTDARERQPGADPLEVRRPLWSSGRALVLLAALVTAWLPALLGSGAVSAAAELNELAAGSSPYWVPGHFLLLYVAAPLVAVSSFVLVLSPGLLLSAAMGTADTLSGWVLHGFTASLIIVSVAAGVVQAIAGLPLQGSAFAVVVAMCSLAAFGVLLWRAGRSGAVPRPPVGAAAVIALLLPPLLLAGGLVPKLYWETLNGDGAHALEASRLLLTNPLPFFGPDSGSVAGWPGIAAATFIYPVSWFVRLFGPLEAAVRLPFLLFLTVLYAGIEGVAAHGRDRTLALSERLLIWLALATFTLVMAFSATYNPYFADIALPGAQDTLQMALFLGLVLSFLSGRNGWSALLVVLNLFCSPNGLLLVGLWLVASVATMRPIPWSRVVTTGGAVVAGLVLAVVLPPVLTWLGQPVPGGEHSASNLIGKFRFLQLTDLRRVAYLVLPGGIVPALALLAWRRHDRVARALTLVTLGAFGLFYVQASISLHYFVPAMVLPIPVLWRSGFLWESRLRPVWLATTAAAALLAFVLSLPSDGGIHTQARSLGGAIEDRIGGYDRSAPEAFRHVELYEAIVPRPRDPRVPGESYGGSALVWSYYAHRLPPSGKQPNYVIQRREELPPPGTRLLAQDEQAALYVRSDSILNHHRLMRPPLAASNRFYHIPLAVQTGRYRDGGTIDMGYYLRRLLP